MDVFRRRAAQKPGKARKVRSAHRRLRSRLAAYERQNRLDRALQECGRLVRTGFMIDWLETPALQHSRVVSCFERFC